MPYVSAPLPDTADVIGQEYNKLRQDLLNGHDHSGAGNGGTISHLDLSNIGTQTHSQIDDALAHLHSHLAQTVPWSRVEMGYPSVSSLSGSGSGYRILYAIEFTRQPILSVAVELLGETASANAADLNVVIEYADTEGFTVLFVHSGNPDQSPVYYPFGSEGFKATEHVRIHWTAMEPPA